MEMPFYDEAGDLLHQRVFRETKKKTLVSRFCQFCHHIREEFVPDFMDVSFGVVRFHLRSLGENRHGQWATQKRNFSTKCSGNHCISSNFYKVKDFVDRNLREQQEGFSKRGLRAPIGDSLVWGPRSNRGTVPPKTHERSTILQWFASM